MNGFPARVVVTLVIAALAAPAGAQTPAPDAPDSRDARFINAPPPATAAFSGLATPPQIIPPPAIQPPTTIPVSPAVDLGQKVEVAPLPAVSPESVGLSGANTLGADMWQGTPRHSAEILLSMAVPTASPVLNDLARRLLTTAAVPPDGAAGMPQNLTSLRIARLAAFADAPAAWALATHADAKAVDDIAFHQAAENGLAADDDSVCAQLPELAQSRASVDWQKSLAICQMRAKDTKAAQVTLDVLRGQAARDDIFLQVADKNVLSDSKTLPTQLTPLTPSLLALLRLTGLPLPGEIYSHPDYALVPALLRAPARQDVAQLGLAERTAARGMIGDAQLGDVYKAIVFKADALTAPLTTVETGSRLRALLYQAALGEKDAQKRISYAVKFMQSAPPDLLDGAGALLASMVDGISPDPFLSANALNMTQIYMMAGRNPDAQEWLKLVKRDFTDADFRNLWPQLVLAGLEADSDAAAIGTWSDAMLAQSDPGGDNKTAHDTVAAALLLFDAAGYAVPDALWAKILAPVPNEKHMTLSPVVLERLRAAGLAGRRGEAVLLSIALAGDGNISILAAVDITRALRLVGLKNEAAAFARQSLAATSKAS